MTHTTSAAGPPAPGAPGAAAEVLAVVASNALDAVDTARAAAPEAELRSPQGAGWTAAELAELAGLAQRRDERDLIVCGVDWLRADLVPRLLKPLEESGRGGRWLLPIADWDRLPAPLQGRVTSHLQAEGGSAEADLLAALQVRSSTLTARDRQLVDQLSAVGFVTTTRPAGDAHQLADALTRLAEHPLVRQAGGRAALSGAVLGRIDRHLRAVLRHHPDRWETVAVAANALDQARDALVWNTPAWPLLSLALVRATAASRTP